MTAPSAIHSRDAVAGVSRASGFAAGLPMPGEFGHDAGSHQPPALCQKV
ncbi:MAG TPA: hypothetical protein VN837_08440 [Chloroflexota bacterium]|nr:hypothetical protein [Chloroflexota bacterium]